MTSNLKFFCFLRTSCLAAVLKSYYNKCLVGRYNKRLIVRTLSFLGPLKMPHSTNTYFSPFMFLACNHLRGISELRLFMYEDAYIHILPDSCRSTATQWLFNTCIFIHTVNSLIEARASIKFSNFGACFYSRHMKYYVVKIP